MPPKIRRRRGELLTQVKVCSRQGRTLAAKTTEDVVLRLALIVCIVAADRIAAWLTGGEGWIAGVSGGGAVLAFGFAHCDTLDGPVVRLARRALETRNVKLVLPWVRAENEREIREAFLHAIGVRGLGDQARSLADRHFLETLVRVHRAGEGAPYTGLKPAGQDLGPAVPAADKALEDGSIEKVVKLLTDAVRAGVHAHFHRARERTAFDPDDVPAGRRYVEANVPYVHYVEKLWAAATGAAHEAHAAHTAAAEPQPHHLH